MKVAWPESYRIIYSRYPHVGIYDRIAEPADFQALTAIEARTNPRILDEVGSLSLVRPEDRIFGPGATPVMASFAHSRASRFSDGSFGIYYAARYLEAAIAESKFHVERFYRATAEPSADIDMRVYLAGIRGRFDDLRGRPIADPVLDPDSYAISQRYGKKIYDENLLDGIVYRSVRDEKHRAAAACFRPRVISNCRVHSYLLYRWHGLQQKIVDVRRSEALQG